MELLTRKEAAAYLRISVRKLDALAATGDIRRVKMGSGQRARVLFRFEDLEAFVQDNLSEAPRDIRAQIRQITRR